MSTCPVCQDSIQADESAFTHHVNSHFDFSSSSSPIRRPPLDDYDGNAERTVTKRSSPPETRAFNANCFICDFPLAYLSLEERQTHLNACLDGSTTRYSAVEERDIHEDDDFVFSEESRQRNGQLNSDNRVDSGWEGPARPGGWSDWVSRRVDKGDRWWDPLTGSTSKTDIPNNFSPSLHPIINTILLKSFHQSSTRSAAVSLPTMHIKGSWGFDMGWGCGYRNALMAISALILARPEYAKTFSKETNGSEPGVRRTQGWIEEAWGDGFDAVGKEQLRGKVLGTRKWIGTTELYAMFSYKAIPCNLYDFPKPKSGTGARPAYVALQQWVKSYFDAGDDPVHKVHSQTAAGVLMQAGRGASIRMTPRFPLILQHSGHSRTIVGYEESSSGTIYVLLFDPGKMVPKKLRKAGIKQFCKSTAQAGSSRPKVPPLNSTTSHKPSHSSLSFSPPYSNGASNFAHLPHDVISLRMAGGSQSKTRALESDEEMDKQGWVKKKVRKVLKRKVRDDSSSDVASWDTGPIGVGRALSYFKVNLGGLGKHDEFQVLSFTGGDLLADEERARRKVVISTVVR